ncbi:MAG: hypothetical protein OEW64_05500 [Gammaproteobacteria bacterium]|nr:hypothetical protein [Gammaproteobacteria bacterium]MDH5303535.1 hypothetical protein [Gammaproteobacteria bacterium]MDH5321877.1 hypothetical protein [Gammaproteobacteria bacterium]
MSGTPGSSATAFWLFLPLAEQGYGDAQFIVGTYFSNGIAGVVPQDREQAYLWYALAAEHFEDEYWRKTAARNRDLVAAKMTDEQVAEARRLAREWKPEPAKP